MKTSGFILWPVMAGFFRFKKTNNRAIAGFLLPFVAAGTASVLVLKAHDDGTMSSGYWLPFVTIIPVLLVAGLWLSIRSISYIEALGDKDYAYSGVVLNIFFIIMYIVSAVIYFRTP